MDLSSSSSRTIPPEVTLISWDPESPDHVERLYNQRLACGWSQDQIEKWRRMQRRGEKALHWIVLSPNDPLHDEKLSRHTTRYPIESTSLSDTATSSLLRQINSMQSPPYLFIPIGHISLDSLSTDKDLTSSSEHTYHITCLYVSRALQGAGIGWATMDAVETLAAKEPLAATALTLDTLAREHYFEVERYRALGREPPTMFNQDWYASRGYSVFKRVQGLIKQKDSTGKIWVLTSVFMRKKLVPRDDGGLEGGLS